MTFFFVRIEDGESSSSTRLSNFKSRELNLAGAWIGLYFSVFTLRDAGCIVRRLRLIVMISLQSIYGNNKAVVFTAVVSSRMDPIYSTLHIA